MRSRVRRTLAATIATALAIGSVGCGDAPSQGKGLFNIGRPLSESELRSWNIDVAPDGTGLPPGQGSVPQGEAIYRTKCIACHGANGQGHPMDRLAGGRDTLASDAPVKTVGSYWPYATTIFDYVRRAMPLDRPQSLTADEVYAVTAYLLQINGLVGPDAMMNAHTLPKVRMPNQEAFRADPRPDVANSACRRNCQQEN
jgi:S-disulfanyl-L-cysteine oxidoreductase SoxD